MVFPFFLLGTPFTPAPLFTAVQGLAGPQGRESVVQPLTCQQIPTVLTGSHRQPQKAVRDKRGGAYS